MNLKKLKIVKFFAAAALSLSLAASADTWTDTDTGYTWTYTIADGKATIEKYTGEYYVPAVSPKPTGVLTIPATLGGKPVTAIGTEAFYGCDALTGVTIPASVTSIGYRAFAYTALTDVTIPGTVKSIGESAFTYCESLKKVTIEDGMESIGEWAFHDCEALTDVTIPGSVTGIGSKAFENCTSLVNVTLGDGLTEIGKGMFDSCASLTQVTIPASVTAIGDSAFYECSGLTSVAIPASVASIGYIAFSGCPLATVYVDKGDGERVKGLLAGSGFSTTGVAFVEGAPPPDGDYVETVGGIEWKYRVVGGKAEIFNNNVAAIPNTTAGAITVPSTLGGCQVTSIGESAFEDCTALTSVTIPDSVTSIGDRAFYGCSSLTSVTIPDSVTSIGESTFDSCSALESVTIGNGVTSIGMYAFWDCSSLTSVTIGNSVTSIGEYAFCYCSKLTSVTIPNSVTSIGGSAFDGCPLATVYVDKGDGERVKGLLAGSGFSTTGVKFVEGAPPPDGDYVETVGGIEWKYRVVGGKAEIYNNGDPAIPDTTAGAITVPSTLGGCQVTSIGDYAFWYCTSLESVTIPDSVTSIGDDAFYYCTSLESVTIPDSVTSIGDDAFCYCTSLKSVTIPDSVTSIGDYAFYSCTALKGVTIPDSVTSIGDDAFYYCTSLESVTIGNGVTSIGESAFDSCSALTSVTIGNGVTSIGDNAFYYCSSLTSVTIGNSVTSIGYEAFYGCSSLTSVTIPDSVTSIGSGAFEYCSSLTSVTIPDGVTSIGEWAFSYCDWLMIARIPASVTSIGEGAFYDTYLSLVIVADGKEDDVKGMLVNSGYYVSGVVFDVETPGKCAVLFLGNGGTVSEKLRKVDAGTAVGALPEATREGYVVKAWAALDGSQVTAETLVNDDAIYYATWILEGYYTETVDGIEWTYRVVDGNAEIFNNDYAAIPYTTAGAITVPSTLGGCQVTSIGNSAFKGCEALKSVTIPDSVTSLGSSVFYLCSALESVTIPDGVTRIGDSAFVGCEALKSVALPEGLTRIGYRAFAESGLESVTLPAGLKKIDGSAFDSCDSLTSVSLDPGNETYLLHDGLLLTKDGKTLVLCFSAAGAVTIPDGVTTIGRYAFYYREALKSVTIPNSVTSIGDYAFGGCSALESVTIPNSVTSIGGNAFYHCKSLESVTIPGSVKSVGGAAFSSCYNLESVTIEDGVERIGSTAFYGCTSLASVTIPDSVTSIGNGAFYSCSALESVTLPAGIADIDIYAFSGTPFLNNKPDGLVVLGKALYRVKGECPASVEIPNGVTSIAGGAFERCKTLESVTIPNSVTTIGDSAFNGCSALASVTIPDSVTSIGSDAFQYCTALESVTIPNSVTSIGEWAFYGCTALASVTLPAGIADIGASAFSGTPFVKNMPDGLVVLGKVLYCVKGECPASVEIPYGVESICKYAFYQCSTLTSVTIPDSVTSIGDYAFYFCSSLKSVTIPDSVTSIEEGAFYGCSALEEVHVGSGVRSTGIAVFSNCTSLKHVELPLGLESIDDYAFDKCDIGEIYIPGTVTAIGELAFGGCPLATVCVDAGDTARVKGLLEASGFDTTGVTFVEASPTCKVTLELNGGSGIETSFEVEPGTKIGLLPIPEGYVDGVYKYENFKGWFWDADFTDEVEPTDVVDGDCTCYAKWGLAPDLQTTVVDGIEWTYFVSGANKITLYNNGRSVIPDDYEGALTIPAKIAGKTVAGIGERAFYGCTGLTSVVIPDGVEDIADKAFAWCENLQAVQFGKGTAKGTIFFQAFKGCARLRALDFKATTPVDAADDAFEDAGTMTGEGKPCVYVPKSAAKNWGDTWMGMRVLAYPFQVQFIMGIMPGKASYGTVTPIPYGPATEIGKKVTLKAKANKTYVFAGWYDCDWNDSENPDKQVLVSRAPSYSYTVTGEFKHFKADFVKEEEDIASLAINVADVRTAGDGSVTIDIGAAVDSYSEPKITLKGLPQGLKYDTKTMTVTGKATKPGKYTVTVSATNTSVKKAKTADFTITVPNFTDALIPVVDEYGPYIPGVEYIETIADAADCTVTGLPTGMKWAAKDVVDNKTKLVTVPKNSVYGAATKPGSYTVYFTKTVGKEKHTATATFTVSAFPKLTIVMEGNSGKDKVTGAGDYAANKKVSLKATPDTTKGSVKVFMGWYDESGNLVSRAASYSYVMPSVDTTLKAKFITQAEDAAHISADLAGVGAFDKDHLAAATKVHCGVYMEWKLDVDAWSDTTVKVAGLPAGLKFTAKDVVDAKTKLVTVPANTIYGTPTTASKYDKDGKLILSAVKITITTSGKTTVNYTVDVQVDPMTVGLYGQFEGGSDAGQATLTVTDKGKVSGKLLTGGLTWTLAAPYLDSFDEITTTYTATLEAKSGAGAKAVVETLSLEIRKGATFGEALLRDADGNEVARLYLTNWKDAAWKSAATNFGKAPVLKYAATAADGITAGTIELKFASSGTVTVTGVFGTYKASGSSPLVPTCFPHDFVNGVGTAKLYVYLPPDAKKGFAGYAEVLDLQYNGTTFSK